MLYGGIEAGGTKFICAVSNEELEILDRISIPTTDPVETFNKVFEFFDKYNLQAIGIGSFGPIDVNVESETYGYITSTPKKHWGDTDFVGVFKQRYNVPIGWNTDVNVAALGELTLGAATDKKSCVYITVGTGIGGGAIVNGELLTGFNHPEMGHIYPPKHEQDTFEGICAYHKNCLEGLASGPAIENRYGIKAKNLTEDHIAWDIEAHYLAHAALSYTLTLSPECIIFGGGVMNQSHLFQLIRYKFNELLGDYLNLPPVDEYIIPTGLGNNSGILGSLLLAKREKSEEYIGGNK